MNYVNQSIPKTDAMALVTGQPLFLDDLASKDCLIVKLLRSPHAHALVKEIKTEKALKVPGIEAIYTYKDVPGHRFTLAGQTYPEPSPQDRLILDKHLRFVGDPVAIVAGTSEKAVDKALKQIRVKYKVLPALLDFHEAKDHKILIHPEDNWHALSPVGADNRRNLCACGTDSAGDVEQVLSQCDVVVEQTYHTKANQQAMLEPFSTACFIDAYGRLNIFSSTQIVFHVRRLIANALGIPKTKVRVSKPRIGGGFGAKQTAVSEIYPAFVTWMTKKPSKIIFTRNECQTASSPRHEMEMQVRIGADKTGKIRAIDLYTLSNTGAYGEHGPTTVGLSGHKSISLYRNLDAFRFTYDVVYTNVMSAGAYRGYGATQGIFAVESAVNELAAKLHMDPVALREQNMVKEGDIMPAYYNETNTSCALDRCMAKAKEMIGWNEKFPCRDMGNQKVRSVGVAMAMQGSGISGVDVGSASIRLNEDGTYILRIGAADMGTGCDTTMVQIAAECLQCPMEQISLSAADTDSSPYDSGSYASSTAYVTGKAVEKACQQLIGKFLDRGEQILSRPKEKLSFDGQRISYEPTGENVDLTELGRMSACGSLDALEATVSHSSPNSPPPFMVGMVEIEVDKETGALEILDYVAAVDAGTPLNPNLVRVQTEGGIVQGIGMALYEDIQYNENGKLLNNSFMQYKIPSRLDMGKIRVELESSYEPSGPFGAKSIGEIVINTPAPALAHAVYNATGLWIRELPITSEKIAMGLLEKAE
ncbi:MAG: xanthine dehydrogenase family protein molybdopterin-binding subunit [Blautia sp.]|jgi:putative selenate reductase molybdopterin-binding subunit